jgi:hypothetical protein
MPEVIDWADIDAFTISGLQGLPFDDLDLDAYLAHLGPKMQTSPSSCCAAGASQFASPDGRLRQEVDPLPGSDQRTAPRLQALRPDRRKLVLSQRNPGRRGRLLRQRTHARLFSAVIHAAVGVPDEGIEIGDVDLLDTLLD